MATINGKTLKEILTELQADFPDKAIQTRDYDGIKYIGVDDYRDRLDLVIGIDHYNEKYDSVEIVKVQDSYAAKTRCTIEILDDNYNVILTKESSGGNNIAFPKIDTGKVDEKNKPIKIPGTVTTSLPNDFDSACQDAFKRICKKQFHMGEKQLKDAEANFQSLFILKISKDCSIHSSGHIFSNGILENDGKSYNLVVFKNTVEQFQSSFGLPKKGDVIAFFGKSGTDKNGKEQLIFKKAGQVPASPKLDSPNNSAGTKEPASNKPVEKKQEMPNSTHMQRTEANAEPANNNSGIKMLFKSTTIMKEVDNYPGCYVMKAKNQDKERVIYFLKDNIEKAKASGKWEKWLNEATKKIGVNFTIRAFAKKDTFYFMEFV